MSTNSDQLVKEQKVYNTFQTIYEDYDKVNNVISFNMHKFWKKDVVKKLNIKKGSKILDVCCGTGDLSIILSYTDNQNEVTGLDFSENMLEIAKFRIRELGRDNVKVVHGNAMDLPFEDSTFDFVTVGFGLRNTPNYELVVKEMMRVVKLGGQVACLDTSMPDIPIYKQLFNIYFRVFMPMIGNLMSRHKEEYKWLNRSTESFLTKKELKMLYEKVGLNSVKVKSYAGGAAALHIGTK